MIKNMKKAESVGVLPFYVVINQKMIYNYYQIKPRNRIILIHSNP